MRTVAHVLRQPLSMGRAAEWASEGSYHLKLVSLYAFDEGSNPQNARFAHPIQLLRS